MFDVDAGHAKAVFDGFAEDEATEDGGTDDRVGAEVGEGMDAFDGNVFADVLVREMVFGDGDNAVFGEIFEGAGGLC